MADWMIWPLAAILIWLVNDVAQLRDRVRELEKKQQRPFKAPWKDQ